jgi:hypothetical protein
MKSATPPSHYTQDAILADGTYVKVYSLGMGRGVLVTWIYNTTTTGSTTSNNTIRLTVQDNSTSDLVLPTTFGQASTVGREFVLPLIVKSAQVIANASSGAGGV